ncbi:histidine kinase dimerization/phospho-acceptor domain-containing protein [Crocosphaera sp. XPORK-15E]|uniref:histidine kinase dimerization/phospho-acceptor domain-containing protein n=1 Tax=Crocosphaera sp. XPORK-15E TaxID=3110247 RepID=UPI002B209D55|nr:transporter substrate-binding domain-containing protein [Crocosphaera sp. XPORK-15E]MEA5536516.1 transporter substrate-binding domain-containing protein [Crocosphaera sp. XPORK-15E]
MANIYLNWRKILILGLLILTTNMIVLATSSPPEKPLRVTAAVPRYFPPIYSVDKEGNPEGFAIDIMEAVAQRANLQVTYKIKDTWAEAVTALETGVVDLIPSLGITPTRAQQFSYTTPIETLKICVFVLREKKQITRLEDLSGFTVAVVQGNEAINQLEKHKNIKLEIFDSPEHALFDLLSGDVEAVAYPEKPLIYLAQAISLDYRLRMLEPSLKEVQRGIAVQRKDTRLHQRLESAVISLINSPDYLKIYNYWYHPTPGFWTVSRLLWVATIILVLTIIIMALWRHYSLRPFYLLKQTQKALKESEARYRGIVEDQTELICRFLPDGTLTFVNQAYCRYFGKQYEDLINNSFLLFIPKKEQQIVMNNLAQLNVQNPLVIHEHCVINYQRKICCQQWTNRGIFDEIGQLKEIQAVGLDITERKQMEEELRKTLLEEQTLNKITDKIHQSFELDIILQDAITETRDVLQCDRVAVYQFNADWSGEFIAESVGEKWVILVGDNIKKVWQDTYLQENQGGRYQNNKTLAVNDIYAVGYQQCHLDLLEQFQAKAYIIVSIFVYNKLWGLLGCYQNSGPRHWHSSEIKLLKHIGNQLGLAIQQSELLNQLQKAKNAAEAASQAKSQFLAHMSHELRTPLNAILGFSQLLSNDPNLNPDQQEYLEIINKSGEHLLSLIRDILDMAKIESGQITIYLSNVNLHSLVQTLALMFQLKAEAKGLELLVIIGTNVPQQIIADEAKLRQILINLLGNAIKFTLRGQVRLNVQKISEDHLEQKNITHLLFEIEDTGPGINIEEAPNLFNPFFQTELGRKSQEGTGLGLAISHHFVNLMGSQLRVSCPLTGGSIFHFSLPVEIPARQDYPALLSKGKVKRLAPDQPSYRILIIEDLRSNRQVLLNFLQPLGFEVREANNGQEGVKLWETWHPHLIWMDLQMPIMDGYEATRQIRAKMGQVEQQPHTKIIALTASVFAEERDAILAVGCDDFVSKPFSESIILEKIAQHLGVCYIYENCLISNKPPKKTPSIHLHTLKTQIQRMPLPWLNQLYKSAAAADGELILQLLEKIPPDQEMLSKAITDLVQNYHFDQIMEISNSSITN